VVVGVADKIESDNCTANTQGTLLHPQLCLTAYKTATGSYATLTFSSLVLWYGLFVLSTVPAAVSNCYKQKVLKGVDLDVVYATFWSGNFQVIWGIMLFWINWIPLPNQTVTTPGQTFQVIADTWQCFLGNVPHPPDDNSCAQEGGPALKWFLVYLFFQPLLQRLLSLARETHVRSVGADCHNTMPGADKYLLTVSIPCWRFSSAHDIVSVACHHLGLHRTLDLQPRSRDYSWGGSRGCSSSPQLLAQPDVRWEHWIA